MAFTKINEVDYAEKGIRVKNNPLGLSVSEAQRAFDELPLDVIIPKVNELSNEIDEYAESTDIKIENLEARATNSEEALGTKVDKEEGKGLSANDYSNEEKQKVADAYADKHTHSNKSVLDDLTATHLSNITAAYTSRHTHPNGTVLDDIMASDLTHLDEAYTNMHTHSNKATLDGITDAKVAEWDSKVDAEYVNSALNEKVTELGAGDMMQATYDPQGKKTDIFKYVDDAMGDIDAAPSDHTHTAEDVGAVACTTPMTMSVTADGILRISY